MTVTMEKNTIVVPTAHADRRLDKFLLSQHKGVPKSLIFRLLRRGAIRVNGRKAKPDQRTVAGDEITLPPLRVEKKTTQVPSHVLRHVSDAIVHEDDDLLVVNKPAGIPVHTGSGHAGGVIEALRSARPHEPDLELAHRIDADTSGAVVIAKNPPTLRALHSAFASERVTRRYLALVEGAWPDDLVLIDAPLLRTPTTMTVHPDGQHADTSFRVSKRYGKAATLVSAQLGTGRRHQIRVHAAHAGHPIIGDARYGRTAASRLMLHAHYLSIPRQGRESLTITVQPDRRWGEIADKYGGVS